MCRLCGFPPPLTTEQLRSQEDARRITEYRTKTLGGPPNDLPNIIDIVLNFVEAKYEPTRKEIGQEIAVEFLKVASVTQPAHPEEHRRKYPRDFLYQQIWERLTKKCYH